MPGYESSEVRLLDSREVTVPVSPESAFEPVRRIGGAKGWYYGNWLWRLRCAMDSLLGGVGMRGRRDPDSLRVGDIVDCCRVEAIEPNHRLRLVLELKQPGRGWLEFVVSGDQRQSTIRQTAIYEPGGLCGRLYWLLVSPVHSVLFTGMLRQMASHCSNGAHPGNIVLLNTDERTTQ